MRHIVIRATLLVIYSLVISCASGKNPNFNEKNPDWLANLGPYKTFELDIPELYDTKRKRKIPIIIHRPKRDGKFPLVIFSHGAGGNRLSNFRQARHLASYGFIVLALEHVGSNTDTIKQSRHWLENVKQSTRNAYEVFNRPDDVRFAIDKALEWNEHLPELINQIDSNHIGVIGHSFGAYTALAIAGVRPALNWLQPEIQPTKGLGPDLSDSRVSCAVALSPQGPGEPFFIENSYQSMRIPVMGITGSRDNQQAADAENRLRGFALWPSGNKYFIWLPGADHLAFSDAGKSTAYTLPSLSRSRVQPVVRVATLLFFNSCLKNKLSDAALINVVELSKYFDSAFWHSNHEIQILQK